eukprot:CAMPEP_0194579110 /NCGR_PEP_ID=MMETSP0292-20121207/13284_1 /TAXON_ID=39354 /ORGANISM="Heterosigma akashiwo, Strain CCMP2393" /LENGTH=277 /DNA_ID=CAMNT_0039431949 /DNA_START=154 /DNA_END=987 /DNA_ORIENTATION=-
MRPAEVSGARRLDRQCFLMMSENSGLPEKVEYFDPSIPLDPIEASKSTVREMPIFPLNMVAVPTGKCPLHIFEMRYRQMMNKIQETDERFGIIMVDSRNNALASVGTTVQVYQRSLLDDGRQLIMNYGVGRFKILKIISNEPYMVALVDTDYEDIMKHSPELAKLEQQVWETLNEVVRLTNKIQDKQSVTVSGEATRYRPTDEPSSDQKQEDKRRSNFSFALANMLDLPPEQKQLMVQTLDVRQRLQFQYDLLYETLKMLAAQSSLKDLNLGGEGGL